MAALKGVWGKIARVNLSTGEVTVIEPPEEVYRKYLGGEALGLYYLFKEGIVDPSVDALGPQNMIQLLVGPTNGVAPNARSVIVTKSAYNFLCVTTSGGRAAAELKFAGWDGIQIVGKAEKPVYIAVIDDKIEIRDASHVWGKGTEEAEMILQKEVLSPIEQRESILRSADMPEKWAALHPAAANHSVVGPRYTEWQSPALPFALGEPSGVLWNLDTHQLLWAQNPNAVGPIASTTKLMTIYLILHNGPDLSQIVTIGPDAASTAGSGIKLKVGDQFTVEQLLYALMLASANNAAVALADAAAGNTQNFVAEMNQTAQRLGLTDLHFSDPDGLSKGSVGSAWDLAALTQLDFQYPVFQKIVKSKNMAIPENPQMWNLNHLLYMD
ncbi:MAG: serine hydrolase, partial [Anaerolineae bacterium]|nr:serine hydrolase [Anaerolineae bacterium]